MSPAAKTAKRAAPKPAAKAPVKATAKAPARKAKAEPAEPLRPFHHRREAVTPAGSHEDGSWEDELGNYLQSEEPMAMGFMRFVGYVKERRRQGWEDERILESARQFVANYPRAFPDVDGEFYAGMKASLASFKVQVEQQALRA